MKRIVVLVPLLLSVAACSTPRTLTPIPAPDSRATEARIAANIFATLTASAPLPTSVAASPTATNAPSATPAARCLVWQEAAKHDGEYICVVGTILTIEFEVDENSHDDVWRAHFSYDRENDLILVSVNRDISKWEGKCVEVDGTLFDRSKITDYVENPQPTMVDLTSDHYGTGIVIREADQKNCQSFPTSSRAEPPAQSLSACISWRDAISVIGKNTCITGVVTRVYTDPKSGVTFIDFSDRPTDYVGFSPSIAWDKSLIGRCVRITGLVQSYSDKAGNRPETVIHDKSQVVFC